MPRRSWKLVALLSIVSLLLSGMGSKVALSAVDPARGLRAAPTATTTLLEEDFEGPTVPAGWQVIGTPGWVPYDPPPHMVSGTGHYMMANSDGNKPATMDTELRTPALNLSAVSDVRLTFLNIFITRGGSVGEIDVSIDNGATWTNLWRRTGASIAQRADLSVPQAAGQSAVRFRFHYSKAFYDLWWIVDQVRVIATAAPTAPGSLSAVVANPNVNLTWTDASSDEANFIVERSPDGSTGWVEAGRVGANVTAFTHSSVTCGTTVFYRVKAASYNLQSGYSNVANITMPACPSAVNGINENFNTAQSLPAGWTMPQVPWEFNHPNTTGGSGNAAGVLVTNSIGPFELRTPVFSMVGTKAVLMTFQTDVNIYAGQSRLQDANVEISSDGGATWTLAWDKKAAYKGQVAIDLSPWAANQPNLMVRFRSTLSYSGAYWRIDDVVIGAMAAPSKPTNLTATLNGGSDVLLAWNGSLGSKYKLARLPSGGSASIIADITDGATTYVDTNVASSTTYQYIVAPYNAAGTATFAGPVSVTTGDRSKRYIDVTISLHAGAVLATPADREKYENIIGYFADALYEQSNGAHILRKVTFYRNGAYFDSSHIQWTSSCHPKASPGGYIRAGTGAHLEFCDVFGATNFLSDTTGQQNAGETLGHEWGHFFYGLLDEYKQSGIQYDNLPGMPHSTDPGNHSSIMNNQFGALNDPAEYKRLNHSVNVPGYFNLESAQGRIYGASGWEVLARPKNQDPQSPGTAIRPYWPELAAVAPAPGAIPRIDLPNAAARGSLRIVWEPGFTSNTPLAQTSSYTTARAIVIDRSALMDESGYLDDIKTALEVMIDEAPLGDSLSIIAFDGTATVVQPLTVIADQSTRDALIAALNGITAGNQAAAAGDALQLALDQLTAADTTSRSVYHITYGGNTSGTNAITTVPGYEAAAIPIHIFGFDPNEEDETELRSLAELTAGEYTNVRTATELETALTDAYHDTSPQYDVTVTHDDADLTAGQTFTAPIVFDASLEELDVEITYLAEPMSATVTLIDPLGVSRVIDPNDCETDGAGSEAQTTCYVEYQAPVGEWRLQVQAVDDMYLDYHVTGITQAGTSTYEAYLWAEDGDTVTYPEPIKMYASVSRDHPIGGLRAVAQVHEADGQAFSVSFHDDGHAPDLLADDGIYSAYIDYTEPGEHYVSVQFDNAAGTGFSTDKSLADGDNEPDTPISENFKREAHEQVSVLGWREDDHTDWPGDPNQAPTQLTVDNVQVQGRIDDAGDADVFQVTVPMDYAQPTLSVRVNSLALGMDPKVIVFASDFAWQFEYAPAPAFASGDSSFFSIDVQPGETFYIKVQHQNAAAETGTYAISAGPYLWSDPIAAREKRGIYVINLPIIAR